MKTRISAGIILIVGSLAGCNMVMDLGRFQQESATTSTGGEDAGAGVDAGPPTSDENLTFIMEDMAPHPTQYFELWVIDATNRIQMHGVLDPLGAENVTVHAASAVPLVGGPYRLDFYADMTGARTYTGIGSVLTNDHAWRIPLVPSTIKGHTVVVNGNDMTVTFVHDTIFTDIYTTMDGTPAKPTDTGLGATIHVASLPAAYVGQLIEGRVINADTGDTVGLYRFPSKAPPFDMVISGIVEQQVAYTITMYIDVNGNGVYDNPADGGADKGWCLQRSAQADGGLDYTFDPTLEGAGTCDVGPP